MLTSLTVPFLPMRTPKPRWIKPSLRPLYRQQCQIRLFQRATERHQSKNQKLKTQLLWLPQFWKSIAAHWLYTFLKNSPLNFWSRELIFTNTIWQRLKVPSFLTSFANKKHVAETATCSIIRYVRDSNSWSHPWQGCVLTKTRPTDQNCGGWIWTNDLRGMSPTSYQAALPRDNKLRDPCGIRTHDTSVKGWCLNRLTNGSWQVTRAGFEPTIPAWKAGVLTTWLTGHNGEWEIRTLAPLSRPTPLAGAPLQPLE